MAKEKLALLGGEAVIQPGMISEEKNESLFKAMVLTKEAEEAAIEVMRTGRFSHTDITEQFEKEFAEWQGLKHAVAYCNGTMSLAAAMFAVGLGFGDEIICPTKTYWASISQSMIFGATPVFCNIDEHLSMDPDDLERCITPKTKAIMVVHYLAYPADMDRIMPIARKYNLKVIEDVSHAQGGLYKGKKLGTFGDIAAMSLMSGKSFACGELGIVVTDNRHLYERALAYGHYDRFNRNYVFESKELIPYYNMPLGGVKGRANQLCTAIGRDQLKHYDERSEKIREAMNYFWDLLEGLPGIRAIRVDESTGSNMAGWYCPHGVYYPEELHGLSVRRFAQAVAAEIGSCSDGCNYCLHTHAYFQSYDVFNYGTPTRIAFNGRDARVDDVLCDPSITRYCFSVPRFNYLDKEIVELYASAYRKVIENHEALLEGDTDHRQGGRWYGFENQEEEE